MNKKLLTSAAFAATALFTTATFASTPPPVDPPTNPGDNSGDVLGPDPTVNALENTRSGPYSVRTERVSGFGLGFGGGTIHYPTGTTGKMGAIAVVPGFLSYESSIKWWGPRLASWGFVVITIDTLTTLDQPDSRADQLSSALDYVLEQNSSSRSAIYGMVDPNRLGAIGWSMGGGGALKLSTERNLKAIIPQAPWYSGFNSGFNRINTPTLIIACELDIVAPVAQHASSFYRDIPESTDKAFLEINGGDHFCANSNYPNEDILGKYGISWMKRFIDGDRRYDQFLCGPNHTADRSINEYRDTCNY